MLFSRLPLSVSGKSFHIKKSRSSAKASSEAKVKAIALSLWILVNCSELHFSENEVYKLSKLPKQSALLSFHWSFISDLRSERISCEVLRACLGHHCANVTFKKSLFGQGSHVGKRGWYNVKTSNLLGEKNFMNLLNFWNLSDLSFLDLSIAWLHVFSNLPSTSFHASGAPRSPRDLQKCFQVQHVYDFTKFHHETPWNDIQILAWVSTATTQMLRCEPWTSHGWVCLFHCSMSAKNLCEVWLCLATKRGDCGGNISFLCLLHPI